MDIPGVATGLVRYEGGGTKRFGTARIIAAASIGKRAGGVESSSYAVFASYISARSSPTRRPREFSLMLALGTFAVSFPVRSGRRARARVLRGTGVRAQTALTMSLGPDVMVGTLADLVLPGDVNSVIGVGGGPMRIPGPPG